VARGGPNFAHSEKTKLNLRVFLIAKTMTLFYRLPSFSWLEFEMTGFKHEEA